LDTKSRYLDILASRNLGLSPSTTTFISNEPISQINQMIFENINLKAILIVILLLLIVLVIADVAYFDILF